MVLAGILLGALVIAEASLPLFLIGAAAIILALEVLLVTTRRFAFPRDGRADETGMPRR